MDRREFLNSAAAFAPSLVGLSQTGGQPGLSPPLRRPSRRRTLYFNDARHFYLYSFEPPLAMADAWRPIDELVGTAVNTFIYGVESAGLFSNTKIGMRAGTDQRPFTSAHVWRAWYNMQSLIDRGLDPLQVLIDRAHQHEMEFITSMRMGGGPRDPRYQIGVAGAAGGGGGRQENNSDFGHPEVREVRYAWLEELAGYPVEGIELDFAFTPFYFKPGDVKANTPLMTEYVRRLSEMIRRKGKDRIVGARVFPTEAMNRAAGLDVRTWLAEGLLNYVAPLFYGYFLLDPDLPFEWLAEAAHASSAEVYPVLQPYFLKPEVHATPAMIRAAAANYWSKGADGLIIAPWFRWPFRDAEKSILTDIGDPEIIREKDKHYFVSVRQEEAAGLGYDHPLPSTLGRADPNTSIEIPFYIGDDFHSDRVARVRLLLKVLNLVTADRLEIKLNGATLAGESLRRTSHRYEFQWLELTLVHLRPRRGQNTLAVTLVSRPAGLEGGVTVQQLEILVEYNLPQAVEARPEFL
jgi:hypothetical protein